MEGVKKENCVHINIGFLTKPRLILTLCFVISSCLLASSAEEIWQAPAFTSQSLERMGSKEYYRSSRNKRYRTRFPVSVYTPARMGSYYTSFYSKYFTFGTTRLYQRGLKETRKTPSDKYCVNYEALSNSSLAMGVFRCPLPFEPDSHQQCCGEYFREYCCHSEKEKRQLYLIVCMVFLGLTVLCLVGAAHKEYQAGGFKEVRACWNRCKEKNRNRRSSSARTVPVASASPAPRGQSVAESERPARSTAANTSAANTTAATHEQPGTSHAAGKRAPETLEVAALETNASATAAAGATSSTASATPSSPRIVYTQPGPPPIGLEIYNLPLYDDTTPPAYQEPPPSYASLYGVEPVQRDGSNV